MNEALVIDELSFEDHQAALAIINWLNNCQTRDELDQVLKIALIPLLDCSGVFYMQCIGEQNTPQLLGNINQSNCCQPVWQAFVKTTIQQPPIGCYATNPVSSNLAMHSFQCDNLHYQPYSSEQFKQTIVNRCAIITVFDAPGQSLQLCFCRLDVQQLCYSRRDLDLLVMLRPALLQTIKLILFQEESLSFQRVMGGLSSQAEPMAILSDDGKIVFQNAAFEQTIQHEENISLTNFFSVINVAKQKKRVWHRYLSKLGKRLYEITLTQINKTADKGRSIYYLSLSRVTNQMGKIFSRLNGAGLTNREIEIAILIYQGTSPREIAEQIHLSYHTVRNHLKSIYSKLGVSTRSEMLVWVG